MTDAAKIQLLRTALIGTLCLSEEYFEDCAPCNHARGICRCRLKVRITEARQALAKTVNQAKAKP